MLMRTPGMGERAILRTLSNIKLDLYCWISTIIWKAQLFFLERQESFLVSWTVTMAATRAPAEVVSG